MLYDYIKDTQNREDRHVEIHSYFASSSSFIIMQILSIMVHLCKQFPNITFPQILFLFLFLFGRTPYLMLPLNGIYPVIECTDRILHALHLLLSDLDIPLLIPIGHNMFIIPFPIQLCIPPLVSPVEIRKFIPKSPILPKTHPHDPVPPQHSQSRSAHSSSPSSPQCRPPSSSPPFSSWSASPSSSPPPPPSWSTSSPSSFPSFMAFTEFQIFFEQWIAEAVHWHFKGIFIVQCIGRCEFIVQWSQDPIFIILGIGFMAKCSWLQIIWPPWCKQCNRMINGINNDNLPWLLYPLTISMIQSTMSTPLRR